MTVQILTPQAVRAQVSVISRGAAVLKSWWLAHWMSLAIVAPILGAAAAVHLIGSANYPRYVDDPGTYLSQAWAVLYQGQLSPYSYFYDHAPAGWIQIAAWAALTDGFNRYDTAVGFGTECMLLAKLASTAMVYSLTRRLGFTRATAALAAALFALSPLAVVFGRWAFLDNIAMPWLLAAFTLALSPRRGIGAATGACACFAMAALSKETFLLFLPAFAWALAQNLDRRNRPQVLTVAVFTGLLLMALYPLMALYKGELLPGPGHNSLLGTAVWQLSERQSAGSLLQADAPMRQLFGQWLQLDMMLLIGGAVAAPLALARRPLRPIVLALAVGWLLMLRDGYVPYMHVITLLPFSAILIATVVSLPIRLRQALTTVLAVVVLAGAASLWVPQLKQITGTHDTPPLRAATHWAARNIPRDKLLVVHDSIWTDLVHHYGYQPRPIIAYKLDTDPAVARDVKRIDYLIVPNWYYGNPNNAYPSLLEARRHAVPVATFGSGADGVKVYRVNSLWSRP